MRALYLILASLWTTHALILQTPSPFLAAGPARINFTKEAGDPAGAFFNLMTPNQGIRLVEDVDLSVGFVDVVINAPAGTYEIAVFSNGTDGPANLATSKQFLVVDAPQIPPPQPSSSAPLPSSSSPALVSSSEPQSSTLMSTSSVTSSKAIENAASTSRPVDASSSNSLDGANRSSSESAVPIGSSSSNTLATGAIVGIVIGCVLLLAGIILLLCLLARRRRQRNRTLYDDDGSMVQAPPHGRASTIFANLQPEPFIAPSSQSSLYSGRSVRAHERQQRITSEVRLLRKQMEELRRSGALNSISSGTFSTYAGPSGRPPSSTAPTSPGGSSADTIASHLEQSRQLNDHLQSRIVELESQLQSAWAMGLSDEPPPGYVA